MQLQGVGSAPAVGGASLAVPAAQSSVGGTGPEQAGQPPTSGDAIGPSGAGCSPGVVGGGTEDAAPRGFADAAKNKMPTVEELELLGCNQRAETWAERRLTYQRHTTREKGFFINVVEPSGDECYVMSISRDSGPPKKVLMVCKFDGPDIVEETPVAVYPFKVRDAVLTTAPGRPAPTSFDLHNLTRTKQLKNIQFKVSVFDERNSMQFTGVYASLDPRLCAEMAWSAPHIAAVAADGFLRGLTAGGRRLMVSDLMVGPKEDWSSDMDGMQALLDYAVGVRYGDMDYRNWFVSQYKMEMDNRWQQDGPPPPHITVAGYFGWLPNPFLMAAHIFHGSLRTGNPREVQPHDLGREELLSKLVQLGKLTPMLMTQHDEDPRLMADLANLDLGPTLAQQQRRGKVSGRKSAKQEEQEGETSGQAAANAAAALLSLTADASGGSSAAAVSPPCAPAGDTFGVGAHVAALPGAQSSGKRRIQPRAKRACKGTSRGPVSSG